jgi:hypothetical protein
VPVLIHLLARRRLRRVPFPSLRLLQAAERRRRTLARLQRPLSLLLRVLAVALAALALAAPTIGPVPGWLPLPQGRAVALVLDDTLSMMTPLPGGAPFDRAKVAVEALLRGLSTGDRVCVVPVSSPGDAHWMPARQALEFVRTQEPTASGAPIAPALAQAARLLRRAPLPNPAVVVLTDLQRTAWQDPSPAAQDLAPGSMMVVDAGGDAGGNLAVTAVKDLTPTAVRGRPVRLQVTVSASGKVPRTRIVLQLQHGGRSLAASEAVVTSAAPAALSMTFVPTEPRDIPVRLALSGGPFGMAADDVRYVTVRAREPIRVAVAAPGGVARYVTTALDPYGEPRRAGIEAQAVEPAALATTLARWPAAVVVVADCPGLDGAGVAALRHHLATDGGVLVYLGSATDARFVADRLVPALTGDSLALAPVRQAPASSAFTLGEVDTRRAPLSAFADPRAGDLGAMHFVRLRGLRPGPQARVMAAFDDGTPAVLAWTPRAGRLVLLNMSADGSWGGHLRAPAYLPLLHRLCAWLARPSGPTVADVLVDERPVIRGLPSPAAQVRRAGPPGEAQTVAVEDGRLPEVKEPGEYEVAAGGLRLRFAANIDARESDVTRTDEAAVRSALAPAASQVVRVEALSEELLPSSGRADMTVPLLLGAVLVFLVESVLSIVPRGPSEGGDRGRVR